MDAKQARRIIQSGINLAVNLAELTPSPVDDKVLDVASRIVANDEYWALAWHVIEKAIGYFDRENRHLVVESSDSMAHLAEVCGCDRELVCEVIQVLIEILQWWTQQCQD